MSDPKKVIDFSLDLNTGSVLIKDFFGDKTNDNNSEVLSKIFETQQIVNRIPLSVFYGILKKTMGSSYTSHMLPFGTIYYQERENFFVLVLQSEERKFQFNHSSYPNASGIDCFMPKSYFVFAIPGTKMNSSGNLALSKTYILTDDSVISRFDLKKRYFPSPFPNFSRSYGSGICWGGSNSPEYQWSKSFKDLVELEDAPRKYLNSTFNTDLSPGLGESRLCNTISENVPVEHRVSLLQFVNEHFRNSYPLEDADGIAAMSSRVFAEFLNRRNNDFFGLFYGVICYWAKTFNCYPYFVSNALNRYSADSESFITRPLGGGD